GFKADKRFHPHLTLARVKKIEDKKGLQRLIDKYFKVMFGVLYVDFISVMESTLTSAGPRYSEIQRMYLKGEK
ncbi:MAG: RNA 2',3'-cyclic phosphodiesterase, partial [Candidatus Altiarchaeales archaeon]|nr:RNA 2',3'-cyclic phosphodiesterase [Candidatus Altiarchaeales archaeon]